MLKKIFDRIAAAKTPTDYLGVVISAYDANNKKLISTDDYMMIVNVCERLIVEIAPDFK